MPKPKDIIKDNPDNPEQKKTVVVDEIKLQPESDTFSSDEQKEILRIVQADVDYATRVQADYVKQKELDLKHYQCEKPSVLESLDKDPWMSDRNLGLARSIADTFQATYLATCWTPDSINFVATKTLDIDNRENQAKFTKWGMGKQEANTKPQVDAFIHNDIVVGGRFLKIYRKTTEEWVDRRIPVKNKDGKTYKYEIKTEKMTFIRGVIENIDDIDDILMPAYGKNIQELPFFIQKLHLYGEDVLDYIKRKIFVPSSKDDYKKKLLHHAYQNKERVLGEQRIKEQKITETSMTLTDVRRVPITLHEWYGYFTKNGRREKYRCIVDLVNQEFLSGKPLRKINRSGKIPFVGRRGVSWMQIIAPIVNAFNTIFNQKTDFQYVTNCPFGFFKPDEGYTKQEYPITPGVMFPSAEPDSVNIPNIQRSMAWAEADFRILFEVLERSTGAASYFNTQQLRNKTLGQDLLVERNSETRFGLGASRLIEDISEAVGMWFELYQDYPPKGLAERVVGEDGEKLFPNLSLDSLRGDTNVQMTPDVTAGSKAYRQQRQMWAFQMAPQVVWLNPQINPRGNWQLTADTYKELMNWTDDEVNRYLGEQPKAQFNQAELDTEWYRFMNGEDFDPPEGETAIALQHLEGHTKQKEEKYHKLADEYKPNFDSHLFKTMVNAMKFMKNVQQEAMANQMAATMIANAPTQPPTQPVTQPTQPAQPASAPIAPEQVAMPGQPLPGEGATANA